MMRKGSCLRFSIKIHELNRVAIEDAVALVLVEDGPIGPTLEIHVAGTTLWLTKNEGLKEFSLMLRRVLKT